MVREVLTNNTFASCSWPKKDASVDNIRDGIVGVWLRFFENNDRISKGCVVDAWLNKAAETKWLATNLLATGLLDYASNWNAVVRPYITFTRTTYTV
tara:strand:- start:175 stop:465 length:291 start_codon:yes stop_codon:yes gene_type:complete